MVGHVTCRDDDSVGSKGACDSVARKKEKGKSKEEVFGCSEGGHTGGRKEGRLVFDRSIWRIRCGEF